MSTNDTATWTCPQCGEEIEGEMVVDPTFLQRLQAHKDACRVDAHERRTHKRVSDWQDKLHHDTRIT